MLVIQLSGGLDFLIDRREEDRDLYLRDKEGNKVKIPYEALYELINTLHGVEDGQI